MSNPTLEPFFAPDGERFIPNPISKGPWGPTTLHGRVVVGLMGAEIERRHCPAEFSPARLTVDMYKLPDLSPLRMATRVVRDGLRIKVIEAELFSNDTPVALATAQLLRRTDAPPGVVWTPPNWDVPPPDQIAPPTDPRAAMSGMWAMRPIAGAMGTHGDRRVWMLEIRDLVAGWPLTPFGRVALAADFASPFANAGDQGLGYINSDVTVYLHRTPVTGWIGFEVRNHGATDGVAIGDCFLYDEQGPIGTASVCALAQPRGNMMLQTARRSTDQTGRVQ